MTSVVIDSRRTRRARYGMVSAWCVLALALLATIAAWYFVRVAAQRDADERFESETRDIQADIVRRLQIYELVLRSGAGVFHGWTSVSRDNWRRFVVQLNVAENYPGLQGIGFARVVASIDKETHVLGIRADGFPDYRIWPEGDRDVYTPIVHLEPLDVWRSRALGYDMLQEAVRRAAMERARDTGFTSLSGKVTLIQESASAEQTGFLLYLPVYTGPPPGDVAARRRQVVGYVYSPIRIEGLMHGLLAERAGRIELQIFDGESISDEARMYPNAPDDPAGPVDSSRIITRQLQLSGRTWTLRFAAVPSLADDWSSASLVAGGGMLVSIVLWAIVASFAKRSAQTAAVDAELRLDIDRRERMTARLREMEVGFRYLFEKNPNPMWVFDSDTLEILEVNDAATVQYGYSGDEFRRMRISDLRPDEDVPKLTAYMRNRPQGLTGSGEWRHLTKDGRTIDVEVASYTLEYRHRPAVLVVVREITERKRAEEALRESEAAARGVLDTALDAYIRMDAEGRITEWNRMAEETFGWGRGETIGRPLADILIPSDRREAHRQGLARYLATGHGPLLNRRVEVQALHRNGTQLPVEITILAVHSGRAHSFSAFLRDLSEKKAVDAQLRQAQKMEAVGQLTGGIAHDFNNLLTVIIGNLELADVGESADPELQEAVAQAFAAAEKGAMLTHRLLAFARRQPLQPVRTDLNEMIRNMIELLRRTLGENIAIDVRLAEDLWPELADTSQLESALLNLTINARDAMPQGGKLTIETSNVSLDADYAAQNAEVEQGDYVMLAVTDTGTGMPPDVVERAFEPFFTTKTSGKGSGLGLSMIYGFAKQSSGHLKIYSEVGHGTTVKLYLPRATDHHPAIAPSDNSVNEWRGSETVLVVEDEEQVRKLVVANLKSLGYRVLDAADGPAAIALLGSDEEIDLLFTDVVLAGGISGRRLAEEAQTLRPGICVLFTSGYTQNSIIHQGKLDPGVHLLSKPYRRVELGRKVREVLDAGRST